MRIAPIALSAGALLAIGIVSCVPGGGFMPGPGPGPIEYSVNRPGGDYNNFDLGAANPLMCQTACQSDPTCRAWTYVNPGVQGPNARCWLKSTVPAPVSSPCCTSGVK